MLNAGGADGPLHLYRHDGTTQTVNLLSIAAANGQTATLDPSIAKLLGDIRRRPRRPGASRQYDGNVDQYDFVPSATQKRKFPTVRVDYNMTNAHRLTFSYRYNDFNSTPDFLNSAEAAVPGLPEPRRPGVGPLHVAGHGAVDLRQEHHQRVPRRRTRTRPAWARTSARASTRRSSTARASAARAPAARAGTSTSPTTNCRDRGRSHARDGLQRPERERGGAVHGRGHHDLAEGRAQHQRGRELRAGSARGRSNSTPTYATLTFGTASVDTVAYNMLDADTPGTSPAASTRRRPATRGPCTGSSRAA